MMTHAYNESYLCDVKEVLGECFDYLINDCGHKPEWTATLFLLSGCAEQIERGNPAYIAGMSGVEMGHRILRKAYKDKSVTRIGREFPAASEHVNGYSPEYWAGWALADYQWVSGRRFKDIFERIPLTDIIAMYPVFHEMDITQFINSIEKRYRAIKSERHLKRIRENRGITQGELSKMSGVLIRNIRAYEQGSKDIDKAKACTLFRLSRVLGCTIEDLLENPTSISVIDADELDDAVKEAVRDEEDRPRPASAYLGADGKLHRTDANNGLSTSG